MKFIAHLIPVSLVINSFLFVDCVHGGEGLSDVLSPTNPPTQMTSNQSGSNNEDRAALDAGLTKAAKMREDRIRGVPLPPSAFSFPNPDAGPHQPLPYYVNLYGVNDQYPDYLECDYDVDEKNYNQSKEPQWFIESLKQIRHFGPEKFPPIKWIAIIIENRAEHKDASTFERSHKVGAIFRASDVFDSSRGLSQIVANATMDRHPFFFDLQRSKYVPMEQQRWIIVEQHAATNDTTSGKPK